MIKHLVIAVDFDGTVVTHDYPRIGKSAPGAIGVLEELRDAGHEIVLWTMRSGATLEEAIEYMRDFGIPLHGVNYNPDQADWTNSPKAYAHIYIDDAALGCPLRYDMGSRPCVDWLRVRRMLGQRGVLPPVGQAAE